MKKLLLIITNFLETIDRRVIYVIVAISLAIPLIKNLSLAPVELGTANAAYEVIDKLEPSAGKIALISADWGPNTQAENMPQTAVSIEHLMRKRMPFALITTYALASPFLESIPRKIVEKLEKENPGEKWVYGKDWVNLGFRPGGGLMIQNLAKAEDFHAHLKTDTYGTPLRDIPCMEGVKTKDDVVALLEFTGLVGALANWIQFFQGPDLVHGCTSITIPEAHIFFSSKQIVGLHEGIAGAAWYDAMLSNNYPSRSGESQAIKINTSLAYGHLVIIAFIFLGNIGLALRRGAKVND